MDVPRKEEKGTKLSFRLLVRSTKPAAIPELSGAAAAVKVAAEVAAKELEEFRLWKQDEAKENYAIINGA